MAMLVTVKPPGREEFIVPTSGEPTWSVEEFGGYGPAQVPCLLDPEQTAQVLGGRLRIHGETGIVYQGIVTRRPSLGEPLLAQGWGWCGTLGRNAVAYARTDWVREAQTWDIVNSGSFTRTTENQVIYIGQTPATTCAGDDRCGYKFIGTQPLSSMTFSANVNHASISLYVQGVNSSGTPIGPQYHKTATGAQTGQTLTFSAGTYGVAVWGYIDVASTPSRADTWVSVYDATLYGTAVTSTTTHNVIDHILTNEIDGDFLTADAAHLAYIDAETTVVTPLVFDTCDANTKLTEMTKHAAHCFGWYQEVVTNASVCVPHWYPRSTTPDYLLTTDEAESVDLDECALDELISVARVHYATADGRAVFTDVTDTDPTHPLVALGITRYGDVDAQTSSASVAATIGALAVAEGGRAQVKGTVTTRVLKTATGAEAYLPDVRGGRMVRVMGSRFPGGHTDCVIRRVEYAGDGIATITLDNEPYRLALMLAKLAKNQ